MCVWELWAVQRQETCCVGSAGTALQRQVRGACRHHNQLQREARMVGMGLPLWKSGWERGHGISNEAGAEGCFCSGAVLSLEGCLPGLTLGIGYREFSQGPREAALPASVGAVELAVVGSVGLPIGSEPSLRPG